jgi:phage virion morphogenesis protein
MTGASIKISVDDAVINAALASLAGKVETMRPLMEEIGGALLTSTQLRFEREQGPDGNPWPKSIRAALRGGKTLTDSGRLVQSLTFVADDSSVQVGTNAIYAAVHQFGAHIEAKTAKGLRFRGADGGWVVVQSVDIPARPFLGIDDDDRAEITHLVGEYLAPEVEQ